MRGTKANNSGRKGKLFACGWTFKEYLYYMALSPLGWFWLFQLASLITHILFPHKVGSIEIVKGYWNVLGLGLCIWGLTGGMLLSKIAEKISRKSSDKASIYADTISLFIGQPWFIGSFIVLFTLELVKLIKPPKSLNTVLF